MKYNQVVLEILEAVIENPLKTLSYFNPKYRAKELYYRVANAGGISSRIIESDNKQELSEGDNLKEIYAAQDRLGVFYPQHRRKPKGACPKCGGRGKVPTYTPDAPCALGYPPGDKDCPACNGTGERRSGEDQRKAGGG